MKIITNRGEIKENKDEAAKERRIAATRFMWIPGARPVIVPISVPRIRARRNSRNMKFFRRRGLYIYF